MGRQRAFTGDGLRRLLISGVTQGAFGLGVGHGVTDEGAEAFLFRRHGRLVGQRGLL